MRMPIHVRTTGVAIAVLTLAVPTLFWLRSMDLILGDPWVIGLLLPLAMFVSDDRSQPQLSGGRLEDLPLLRLTTVALIGAALCWNAGWTMLIPASTALASIPLISHPRVRTTVHAATLVVVTTALGQVALWQSWAPSIVEAPDSYVGAGLLLVIALLAIAAVSCRVADQQVAADALERAEARLRALMDSSTDVLTLSDENGLLTYVSSAAKRALGYTPSDLEGHPLLDLVDSEHRPAVAARLEDVVSRGMGARSSMDVLAVHVSLERRWYEWTFQNMLGDSLVQGMVVQQRDVSDRLQAQRALAHAASHDDLTGLPNRGELLRRMLTSLPQAGPGAGVAVLFVDLDLFKDVNDHLGHQAGDDVLVVIARRLAASLRGHDHLGRLGGDEFGVLLTEVRDEQEVKSVIERLVSALEQPITLPGTTVAVGASVGYALTTDPDESLDHLLATADARMYETKNSRRR
jgi:diguanylate cyclase (GGDEF)-like protein/PAS domain S-box-containing protein